MIKNIMDLKKKKEKEAGIITPESLLEDALAHVDEIQDIVMVVRTKDGYTMLGSCAEDPMIVIGLLEAGKTEYIMNIGVEDEY